MAHRLYGDLAWVWPVLSPVEDYRAEGRALLNTFKGLLKGGRGLKLLDLGCGAGHLHSYLTQRFAVTGVDLSPAMLELAKKVNPSACYVEGDLRTFRMNEKFDAVLLHDAANYLLTRGDLVKAFKTIKTHLKPGGVGIILPDYDIDSFEDGESAEAQGECDGRQVQVLTRVERSGRGFALVMTFAIEDLKTHERLVVEDRHQCGLFGIDVWLEAIDKAGLDGEIVQQSKGVWKAVEEIKAGPVAFKVS